MGLGKSGSCARAVQSSSGFTFDQENPVPGVAGSGSAGGNASDGVGSGSGSTSDSCVSCGEGILDCTVEASSGAIPVHETSCELCGAAGEDNSTALSPLINAESFARMGLSGVSNLIFSNSS